ncbi:MAG: hypothetical protein F6K55_05825 [Moorea sp. SIO4A3]|nr:hypothetical protein [Moorena sp. SIO4A3]
MHPVRCSVGAATLRKRLAKGLRYANAKRGLRPQLPRLCDARYEPLRDRNRLDIFANP